MLKKILLPALSAFLPLLSPAQLVLGWSGGYANPHELNRIIYVYNSVNKTGLTQEMKPVHWCQGPMIGFLYNDEKFMAELSYSRKRAKVASEFDSSGTAMTRELKVLSNTYNFGLGMHLADGNHNFPNELEGLWTVTEDHHRSQVWTIYSDQGNGAPGLKKTLTLKKK